ncbi:MAG TPA: MMPL family transporter [Leptospiraceae bacterium]|nr:MMPL family transporter [Leptospiraceae bacterium]HMW06555.1 MMPL family transporter [Leptospiraceae bacterium]HMX32123.1 MMPL family transporter [Leptospiraceae bacterium]HMY31255.1 MMPL family transporter [Leptospiraceae bacterium]HNA06137.1 MMPL family transporter [Leptospiraceae bacterium]
MKNLISILCHIFLLRPFITLVALVLLIGLSIQQALKLSINSNQLDLLPASMIEVIKAKDVVEMIGGNGFYIVALKIKDEYARDKKILSAVDAKKKGNLDLYKSEMEQAEKIKQDHLDYYTKSEKKIKRYADKLTSELLKDKDIRYISYKYDTTFLKERLPLYIKSSDMREARSRIKRKIDEEIEKLNPFYINLTGEEYTPTFDDILSKYQRLAKRDVFDAYNISPDKGMLLLLVKPEGSFLDLNFTRNLEVKIKKVVADLKLEDKGIHVAYSGSYKLNLDDYDSLVDALKPISMASLIGITILLFLFFRNPLFILILVISLLTGIALTFGVTGFVIGRLNTVTTIMAAVLMGLGIDYGIQFLYRFREEFTLRDDLMTSVTETIFHTGIASLISALTTTSAFVVLMFSDFKGFSEFGLIACYGIILIALSMYFVTALQIAIIFRLFPSFKRFFVWSQKESEESSFANRFFANPRLVLRVSIAIIIVISLFAPTVKFNYSGRDLLLENQESLLIYDEIGDRFDVSSDPQAIATDTLEKSEAVFDFFTPVPEHMQNSVDQVVSIWNIIPPENQQKENLHILKQIKDDLKYIKPHMLTEEQQKHLPTVDKYLGVKDFSYYDVPFLFTNQFTEVPTSKVKGHMLFIYPKVALWHGKDLIDFYDKVAQFEYPLISKRTLNAILYSTNIDLDKNSDDHIIAKYTKEEEETILKIANSASKEELMAMNILPLTAQLIVDKRPFTSIEQMRSYKDTAHTAGSVILFAKLAMIVQREAYPAVAMTLTIVLIILIVFYRGLIPAILSLFPLVVGLAVMLGIMGIFGAKVNFFNVLVFPIVIGYGIQNGIYIYYRFMEEKNIGKTVSRVGPAIIASTLTTLVGWGVLLIAEHRGLHSLGVVASIGIGSSLLVALTLLPSVLAIVYAPKKEEEKIPDLSLGLNVDTAEEKAITDESTEELIDLDSDSKSDESTLENKDGSRVEVNEKQEELKDSPIDLDNDTSETPSIDLPTNVDTNLKEKVKEKLEALKDSPIDLDSEDSETVPEIKPPVKVDLNLKEDLKVKLTQEAQKKTKAKKPSKKKKEEKLDSTTATEEKVESKLKKPRVSKKKK